jgi:RNA polymerase primary sigma factor
MTNEELVDRIQKGINPGDNMEQLYNQNQGYIYKIARKYVYADDIDDLLQEAYFGLYEAVNRYEDTAGVLFMTYASFWIKQAMKRYLENNGRSIRIPSGLQANILKYKSVITSFEMQLGRKPTDKELCRYIGVGIKVLQAIKIAYNNDIIQSLDECLPCTDDLLVGDSIPDQSIDLENNVIDGMMERGLRTELWQIVKDNVSPEQNTVITARYRKGMTVEATGQLIEKSRDMTRGIEAKALRKLRASRVRRELEEKFEVNYARAYSGSLSSFINTWNSIVENIAIRNLEIEGIK